MAKEEEQPTEKSQHSRLLLVASGILIPVAAILAPYLADLWFPKAALRFETEGPIEVEQTKAFSIAVRNDGKSVEKNVEIWLPSRLDERQAKIQSTVPYKARQEEKSTVVVIGDLRPSERARVSIVVTMPFFFLNEYHLKALRVVSENQVATWDGRSEETEFIYRAGFWDFLILMSLAILAGIYQEYFMSRKRKEQMLLREIDKLK